MDLILIRHGQPDWFPGGLGSNDPHLTDLGLRQASRLAAVAKRWGPVDQLWVSPLRRAGETAAPLAEALHLDPRVEEWTAEIANPPEWEGSPIDLIEDAWIRGNLRPLEEMWEGMPGGESFRDFHQRVVGGLEEAFRQLGIERLEDGYPHLWEAPSDYRIAVVAHGGTNAVILGALLGLEPTPWEWDRFDSPHTGVARLTTLSIAHGSAFSLRAFADVTHLEEGMVTK
ncbi:MAG TPA: histidine phosphatase family protein [Acidimicrobiia bacterium]|nr:histidine phosphatase family protein [Acidimicrobiia bacterium]